MAVCWAFPSYQPYIVDALPGRVPPDRHIVLQDGMSVLFMATRSTLEVKSVRERSNLPQKPVRLGVRCVDSSVLSAAYYLALLLLFTIRPEVRARGGGGAEGGELETSQKERRDKVSGGPGLVSVMGVWPSKKGRHAYTQPEHTDKSSGKLKKTFPFSPDFL